MNSKRSSKPRCLVVGFDTEYKNIGPKDNKVLSYQLHARSERHSWSVILYPDTSQDERFSFQFLIESIIEKGLGEKKLMWRPNIVVLALHFAIADISSLADANQTIRSLDHVSKSLVTTPGSPPIVVRYYDRHRNEHSINVVVRDTWLIAPEGKRSLAALGDAIGVKKHELPPDTIEKMDEFLITNKPEFETYALRDAEIAAEYLRVIFDFSRDFLGTSSLERIPITIGSMATALAYKVWKDVGIDHLEVLGLEEIREGKQRRTLVLPQRALYERHAEQAFAGGRNEAYYHGVSPEGAWVDIDVASAYATCMATIGMPKWSELRAIQSVDALTLGGIGFAEVEFEFPSTVRFPNLPVRSGSSLVFPLRGISSATHFDILLAKNLGASLRLLHGCTMPVDGTVFPFSEISSRVRTEREAAVVERGKGCLRELLVKTVGNSVYGKTAQGIRDKNVYNTRTGRMEPLPRGRLTNPFIAAYVTGLLRSVIGEILNAVPSEYQILSVTTDGFLTNFPEGKLDTITAGPICEVFRSGLSKVAPGKPMLEIKHRASQVIVWKTRGQVTSAGEGSKPILARAGFQLPRELSIDQQAEYMVTRFVQRSFGDANVQTRMRNVKDIVENGGDLTRSEKNVRLTMDFDWKRFPQIWGERTFKDAEPLWFDTTPVASIAQYEHVRECWEEFYKRHQRPLKREADLMAFFDFVAVRDHGKYELPFGEAAMTVALRAVLCAFKRGLLGLPVVGSNKELAEWLSGEGFVVSVTDAENAARPAAWFSKHCVEETPAVGRLLAVVRAKYPTFDPTDLLALPW